MRIGILTFHRAFNCGAMLQAWALQETLEDLGHVVSFPSINHVGENRCWRAKVPCGRRGMHWLKGWVGKIAQDMLGIGVGDLRIRRYDDFRNKFLNETPCTVGQLIDRYDVVVVGSDQVWSLRHAGEDAPLFLAESIPSAIKKIAYAASYGDEPLAPDSLQRVARALPRFYAVSVREPLASAQLGKETGMNIPVVCDPTLLVSRGRYDKIASGKTPCEPYLFMYTLSTDRFFINTARELSRRLGVKCVIAPCDMTSRYGQPKNLVSAISPDRIVQYTKNAKYVVAASFHGTALGVIFNKPLISLRGKIDKYESRPAALLNALGIGERVVNPKCSLDAMFDLLNEPLHDYSDKLESLSKKSREWLHESLKC